MKTSSEPDAPEVFGFGEVVSLIDHALTGANSFRVEGTRLIKVCSAFEEVSRLHFVVSFGTSLTNLASFLPYRAFLLQAMVG